jgi:DNA-binding NtrC family response regulator
MGSELFGHEKGAFTGADRCRDGFCAEAHGGTLFLDEVGELPLDYQVRLLRVLDGQSFTRVGSTEPRISDLHVVAATNRDLGEMVRKGKFRQDLFFRLNVFPISVPALRERPKDIPYLAEHFVARLSPAVSIDPNSKSVLQAHSWPGNVRELRNTIERSALLSGDGVIRPLYVKQSLEMYTQDQSQGEDDVVGTLEEVLARLTDLTNGKSLAETLDIVELGIIKFTAALYGGNMSKTARVLSTELKRVRSRLREAGLTKDDLR